MSKKKLIYGFHGKERCMARLKGKTAVITGGAGDIGSAVGALFLKEGAKVLLVDLNEDALKKAVAFIGNDKVSYAVADVTRSEQVKYYVKAAVERYGGIDVFINNAGIEGEMKSIVDYPIEVFDKLIAVNIRGVWLGLKCVIPVMEKRGGGSIIITSSLAGTKGFVKLSAYVASKHAVVGMMRTAALECARLRIRVNTVNPGAVESRMMRVIEEGHSPGAPEEHKRVNAESIPLGRYALPEEVARIMLFLASDENQYCTGGMYSIDGGLSAC